LLFPFLFALQGIGFQLIDVRLLMIRDPLQKFRTVIFCASPMAMALAA